MKKSSWKWEKADIENDRSIFCTEASRLSV